VRKSSNAPRQFSRTNKAHPAVRDRTTIFGRSLTTARRTVRCTLQEYLRTRACFPAFGWGVVFPDAEPPESLGPALPRQLVIDANSLYWWIAVERLLRRPKEDVLCGALRSAAEHLRWIGMGSARPAYRAARLQLPEYAAHRPLRLRACTSRTEAPRRHAGGSGGLGRAAHADIRQPGAGAVPRIAWSRSGSVRDVTGIQGTRGNAIVLCETRKGDQHSSEQHLYVAASRARHVLAVAEYRSTDG
jgi:hypothetical protein